MAAIDIVAAARSRHRVGGSSEAAEILAAFLRRGDVAFWHFASFAAPQYIRSLLGAQRTLIGMGAGSLGRD